MGPDLTRVYSKMGPEGLNSALETLFFPAMTPLFRYRPLTANERRDLAALFESADRQQSATPTAAIGAISLAGFFILVAVTGVAGRRRVRSVRRALLEKVTNSHEGEPMSWIRDLINPNARTWEEFYRNRWQHDRVVRSTHGVNCTGSCSWMIYVKDGIVTWEMQATDYPKLEAGLPRYEPRGCPRGIVFSWYIYSPLRIKYPYVRGVLLDTWREARSRHADPVEAWAEIMDNPAARREYQAARGKGGFRRDELGCSRWRSWPPHCSTPRRNTGRTEWPASLRFPRCRCSATRPGPASCNCSAASSAVFLRSVCGLPPASPETWGEKTDVARKRRLVQQQIHRNVRAATST